MSDKSLKEGYYQLQDQKTNTQKYRNNGYQPKKGPIPPPPKGGSSAVTPKAPKK